MNKNSISRSIGLALEQASLGDDTLLKISQDDFDDGVQTLVLHYADRSVTVTRIWPNVVYRGTDSGDSLHERYVELSEAISDPNELWEMIQKLTEPGPKVNPFHPSSAASLEDFNLSVSTEGFLGDKIEAVKESLAQWTVGFRKWKAGGWDKLSDADKMRGIKKAKLLFFYYNPKYVKNLERIMSTTKALSESLISDAKTDVQSMTNTLKKEMGIILKGLSVTPIPDKLNELKSAYAKALGAYKAPENARGDDSVIDKIVTMTDRYKVSTSTIDALKAKSKSVSVESGSVGSHGSHDGHGNAATFVTAVSLVLFLTGMWAALIIWLLIGSTIFMNEGTGGPMYE